MEAELKDKNHIEKVQKRDGRIVNFEQAKIEEAVHKAVVAANQGDGEVSKKVSDKVVSLLNRRFKKGEIPNSIKNVDDKILNEILICETCDKNFRITQAELSFYKRMNLPLPHKDFECRHKERISKRNPRKLWHRKCMKENCQNKFETAYAPDRPEIVYCESCYNQEIY